MLQSHVSVEIHFIRQFFAANFTREIALEVWFMRLFSCRLLTVHLPLMYVYTIAMSECFVAEFARKPPLFIRLNASIFSSGRVVTLVVGVQLFNAVMVAVADLTHHVAS